MSIFKRKSICSLFNLLVYHCVLIFSELLANLTPGGYCRLRDFIRRSRRRGMHLILPLCTFSRGCWLRRFRRHYGRQWRTMAANTAAWGGQEASNVRSCAPYARQGTASRAGANLGKTAGLDEPTRHGRAKITGLFEERESKFAANLRKFGSSVPPSREGSRLPLSGKRQAGETGCK